MKRPETAAFDRIVRARANLILDAPFFGVLATRLELREDATCRDMWTDGKHIGYNPRYVAGLMDVELKGLVAHLVMHVAMGHPWRMAWRDPHLWDIATDEAIYPILMACGMRLPAGSIISHRPQAMCAEMIYAELQKEAENQHPTDDAAQSDASTGNPPQSGGVGNARAPSNSESESGDDAEQEPEDGTTDSGSTDSGEYAPRAPGEVRPAPDEASEEEWAAHVQSAALQAGSLPGALERFLESVRPVDSDWKSRLWNLVEAASAPEDTTWSKPNRRWLHQGLYMPSRESSALRCLVFARDTSASIPNEYLAAANSELQAIVDQLQPQSVLVVDCDAEVQDVIEVEDGVLPDCLLKAKGGGGTRFEPVFEWLKQEGVEPSCVVYMTDLEGSFGNEPPEYPVIWAVPEAVRMRRKAPFGDIVDISV